MSESSIDVARLVGVLENRVESDRISWRQAAGSIGVSPSLLSRLRNYQRPDLDAFAKIVKWLGVSADQFLGDDHETIGDRQTELSTEVSVLLRARKDLSERDKEYLEDIFRASLQHVRKLNRSEG
jgi:transcriptional regulator with XRE-family HTH domain